MKTIKNSIEVSLKTSQHSYQHLAFFYENVAIRQCFMHYKEKCMKIKSYSIFCPFSSDHFFFLVNRFQLFSVLMWSIFWGWK